MDTQKIDNLLETFGMKIPVSEWKPYGHGHINDTFLVRTPGNIPDFILQRKNHHIFKDIAGMMNNIVRATNHIRKKLMAAGESDIDRKVMTYISTPEDDYFVKDDEGNYWTLFLFIRGSHGIEEVSLPAQAFSAGKAFGRFQEQLSDLPGKLLIETIPSFHNGKFRLGQFRDALSADKAGRVSSMKPEIDKILSRAEDMVKLQDWLDRGELPLRVTHNDTKINNVLYDENDQILCIIDLDTVMPGTALFDFGDAIRSLGNTASEDEPDLSKISFHRQYFRSFAEGYLSESNRFLTKEEKHNLPFSCRYMVWEQGMRFLTDYLNGDTYYKIAYPGHNKTRTLAQLRYLEVMEENYDFMKNAVSI
jgi:Ser/Thr protein kinase RdoA (MazF antagonist)